MYAKLHNFFLNKFLEGSKEILKKLKGGQWTMPGIWNWTFPRNISNFIAPFLSVVNCDCGEFITDSSIFPSNFLKQNVSFNTTRSTSRCFHSRRWCFINEGVASCYDFVVPGHSTLVECADCEKIEVHVPFVGKHFLAL